jgi:hypothetical protein
MAVKVVRGSVETNALNYKLAATQTIAKGDLVRITSAGTIKLAAGDTGTAGAIHGIALKNGAATGVTSEETKVAGDLFPIAVINAETVLAIPLPAATDFNALSTTGRGLLATITPTTQAQRIIDATASGIVRIVGIPTDDQSFNPDVGNTVDGGDVYVKVEASVLAGRAA